MFSPPVLKTLIISYNCFILTTTIFACIRIFRESLRLPVLQPENLKAVIYCLQKEQLLCEAAAVEIIKQTIDIALEMGECNGVLFVAMS